MGRPSPATEALPDATPAPETLEAPMEPPWAKEAGELRFDKLPKRAK